MSEVITDFEDSTFTAVVDDGFVMMENDSTGKHLSEAIEVEMLNITTDSGGTKVQFKLEHPRTYR